MEKQIEKEYLSDKQLLIIMIFLILALIIVMISFKIPPKLECFKAIIEYQEENMLGDLPHEVVCIETPFNCDCKFYYWNGSEINKIISKERRECCSR